MSVYQYTGKALLQMQICRPYPPSQSQARAQINSRFVPFSLPQEALSAKAYTKEQQMDWIVDPVLKDNSRLASSCLRLDGHRSDGDCASDWFIDGHVDLHIPTTIYIGKMFLVFVLELAVDWYSSANSMFGGDGGDHSRRSSHSWRSNGDAIPGDDTMMSIYGR